MTFAFTTTPAVPLSLLAAMNLMWAKNPPACPTCHGRDTRLENTYTVYEDGVGATFPVWHCDNERCPSQGDEARQGFFSHDDLGGDHAAD